MALLCRISAYSVFALAQESNKRMIVYARLQNQGESNILSCFHVEDNVKFLFIHIILISFSSKANRSAYLNVEISFLFLSWKELTVWGHQHVFENNAKECLIS